MSWGGAESSALVLAEVFVGPDLPEKRLLTLRIHTGPEEAQDEVFMLSPTPCTFGGRRWWLLCPWCSERVLKLHWLRGGPIDFRCRRYHDLTYESVKTAHFRERSAKMVGQLLKKVTDDDQTVPKKTRPSRSRGRRIPGIGS